MLCDVMSWHVMSCHIMSCHVMSRLCVVCCVLLVRVVCCVYCVRPPPRPL